MNAARATTMAELKPWDHWADLGEVHYQPHHNRSELPERARQFLATIDRCQAGNDRVRDARLGLRPSPEEVPPTSFQSDSDSPSEDDDTSVYSEDEDDEPPSPVPLRTSAPASRLPERAPPLWQCTFMEGQAAPASHGQRIEALRETWLSHSLSQSQGHHPTDFTLASHAIMALQ